MRSSKEDSWTRWYLRQDLKNVSQASITEENSEQYVSDWWRILNLDFNVG